MSSRATRLNMMDELRRFVKVDSFEAVKIGGEFPEAAVHEAVNIRP